MIALDTTVIIDFLKGNKDAIKIIEKYKGNICSTIINYLECISGINPLKQAHTPIDQFFTIITTLRMTQQSIKLANQTYWELKEKGEEVPRDDCLIYGVLQTNNITSIITRNEKHFQKFKNITVLSY